MFSLDFCRNRPFKSEVDTMPTTPIKIKPEMKKVKE
jgi:hypothetical protein